MAELPIIVLAFANEQEGRRYLRDLPEELRRLQEILKEAERNGLCRLEVLPNATLDQIFDVFTRNRDQVAILHYAGHADSGRLLLESSAAGGAAAHAAGWRRFSASARGCNWYSSTAARPGAGCPAARSGCRRRDRHGAGHRRWHGARVRHRASTPSWPPAHRSARPTNRRVDVSWPPMTPRPRRTTRPPRPGVHDRRRQPRPDRRPRLPLGVPPGGRARRALEPARRRRQPRVRPSPPPRARPARKPVPAPELVHGRARRGLLRPRLPGPRVVRAGHRPERAADLALARSVGRGQVVAPGRRSGAAAGGRRSRGPL